MTCLVALVLLLLAPLAPAGATANDGCDPDESTIARAIESIKDVTGRAEIREVAADTSIAGAALVPAPRDFRNITLGVESVSGGGESELDRFAGEVGGLTYKDWARLEPDRTELRDFATEFEIRMKHVVDTDGRIHFNLSGVDVARGTAAQSGTPESIGYTNWELLQIRSSPALWSRTTFYVRSGFGYRALTPGEVAGLGVAPIK